MALESAAYVNGLVSSNPPSGDPVTQADDHLRLIKQALLATFPNLSGPVTSTPLQLNSPIPVGSIHLWYSTVASIPSGYGYCDGSTYAKADGSGNIVSPDLRDRFVLGTGPLHAQGTSGGASSVTTATGSTTATGGVSLTSAGGHDHGGTVGSTVLSVAQMPNHSHVIQTMNTGGSTASGSYAASAVPGPNYTANTDSTGGGLGHNHTISSVADHTHTATFTGTGHVHSMFVDTVPPYVSLPYMIKL